MLWGDSQEVITPFQKIMRTGVVVSIYEGIWRRFGYYLASSRSFDQEMQTVLRLNRGKDDSRVLDLACGTGVFTRPLASQAQGIVVGLDLSWPMLRQASRLLEHSEMKEIFLIRGTAFRLPFVEKAFSCVNCCGALHLFDRPDLALEETRRVLIPSGHLCVQTIIRPAHLGGLARVLGRFTRFGFFDEDDLRERIRAKGFEILESHRHRISFTFLARQNS